MTVIYRVDARNYYTGESKEIDTKKGIPVGWTTLQPPELDEGQFALFLGNRWQVANEYPTPQVRVPHSVTARQAHEALIRTGMYGAVQPAIDAIQGPMERAIAQNFWDKSNTFERDNPVLNNLTKDEMGMTDEQLDELFIFADTL